MRTMISEMRNSWKFLLIPTYVDVRIVSMYVLENEN